MAYGCDAEKLPPEVRTFGFGADPASGGVSVGRLHQPGFFEGLLGQEPGQRYLCCVSRSHLEVAASRSDAAPCFDVTNQSANPVLLAGRRKLGRGDRGALQPGDCIEFIGNNADGSGEAVTYLKLRLERADTGRKQRSGADARREQEFGRLPATQPAWPAPPPEPPEPARARSPAPSAMLPAISDVRLDEPPPFWLTLAGTAVREAFPAELKRLDGRGDGLTVGRAHQQALHANAFDPAVRQYLSRDHFRIECSRDRQCRLVPLSSNPIWRLHAGVRKEAVVGEPALPLVCGDEILLFTGADDCTPDGPGNLGVLRWTFREASGNEAEDGAIDGPTRRAVPRRQAPERGPAQGQGQAREGEKDRGCFGPWQAMGWQAQDAEGPGGALPSTPRRAGAGPEAPAARGRTPPPHRSAEGTTMPLRVPAGGADAGTWRRAADISLHEVNDKFAASGFRY